MFVVPILVIFGWFQKRRDLRIPKRAIWRTLSLLVPLGFGLDFFFANRFFLFQNEGATLGIGAPALGGPVPVEEYLFYFTGFTAVLLIYVWLDEYWLAAYNRPDYSEGARRIPRLIRFHPESLGVAVALIAAAVVYKMVFSGSPEGFPGYFCVLTVLAFVPSAGLFGSARPFINWRFQPRPVPRRADQPGLGGDARHSLRVVGIPGPWLLARLVRGSATHQKCRFLQ